MATQKMVIGGYTFAINPATDTDFNYEMVKTNFGSPGSTDDIIQITNFKSGVRTFKGTFFTDADYSSLEALFLAGQTVACTDWFGNTFYALITKLTPERVNDIIHDFQTRLYTLELTKRPGL